MPDNRWQELTDVECHKLLAQPTWAAWPSPIPTGPAIFPVDYALDEGTVVFRTDPGSKLDAIAGGARSRSRSTRSTGQPDRLERGCPGPGGRGLRAGRPGPPPRAAAVPVGAKARYVRIRPVSVSGRRIAMPANLPFTWWG